MRFLCLAAACALVACGSSDARVQHAAELEFGNVALGESLALTLQITNTGEKTAELALAVDSAEFTIDQSTLSVPVGSATLTVHFSPSALGPRTGTLTLGSSRVALSGRGIGPMISTGAMDLVVGPLAIVTGKPTDTFATTITLRNTGTSGSVLRLGTPRVEGTSELCVGSISGSTCVPWTPPAGLEPTALLEVPIAISPSSEGTKRWTVFFPSNDPLTPELAVEVRTNVETFEPCQFLAPSSFVLTSSKVLSIRHGGPGTCLVRDVLLNPDVIQIKAPQLPLRLASNGLLNVELTAPPYGFFPGVVRVLAAGTDPFEVPFEFKGPVTDCLRLEPYGLHFGTIPLDCGAPIRHAVIYNTCTEPVVLDSVSVGGAGEPAGGPHCRGPLPCSEFSLIDEVPSGTVVPAGESLPIAIRYRPFNYGYDRGYLAISERSRATWVLELQGASTGSTSNTDTFRTDVVPLVDVLVMVDASRSFVPKRESVRQNLLPMLNLLQSRAACVDARFAFAPADGSPDAGVRLQPNDAGEQWTSTNDPEFVTRVLSAFDTLPIGSEQEACIGPAADLIADAGVRDGGYLTGICVTDALEQTDNPLSALDRLQRQLESPSRLSWNAIANYGARCTAEEADDGVHASLVTATYGIREDICVPTWGQSLVRYGGSCSPRTSYWLTSRPVGGIEVSVEGVLIPPASWMYDASQNAVIFLPAFTPGGGLTVTITYDAAICPP